MLADLQYSITLLFTWVEKWVGGGGARVFVTFFTHDEFASLYLGLDAAHSTGILRCTNYSVSYLIDI